MTLETPAEPRAVGCVGRCVLVGCQAFDADVAEGDGVLVAEEAEVAVGAGGARVFFAVHRFFAGFGDVGVQDFVAVDVDG